jgi:hypothetical protein
MFRINSEAMNICTFRRHSCTGDSGNTPVPTAGLLLGATVRERAMIFRPPLPAGT